MDKSIHKPRRSVEASQIKELERRVQRLRERCQRGRSYERSIAGANDALEDELKTAEAELAQRERRAGS